MAHTTGTSLRAQRLSALVAITLVATAVGFAFGRVFEGHGATYRLVLIAIASGVVAWAFERRSLLLATAVSACLLLVCIGIVVFPHTTWVGVPTLSTLRQIGHAAARVGEEARTKVSPAPAGDPSLMLAGITAVWASVFSCYALAFRAGSPLLSLVPPIALVAFADSVLDAFRKPAYGIAFLVAALAVVFADSIRRIQGWGPVWSPPGARNRLLPAAGRNARRLGAGALAVAVLAPFIVPGFGTKAVIDLTRWNSDRKVGVSPLVQIGALLKTDSPPVDLFTVTTAQPTYWRMTALEQFDPSTGLFEQASEDPKYVGANMSLHAPSSGLSVNQRFTVIADLAGFPWLVTGAAPQSVDQSVNWYPGAEALTTPDGSPPGPGSTYQVSATVPQPTRTDLREIAQPPPTQFPAASAYSTIDMPPEIRQAAEAMAKGAETYFDKVVAIQDSLRSWLYDTTVQYPASMQGIVRFLHEHRGFCQQYATAMTVLLRSIGIPARVVVGFTQGQTLDPKDPSTITVTTKDAHSWVEVPFGKYGWLTFEPTPSGFDDPATATYLGTTADTCPGGPGACSDTGGKEVTGPIGKLPHGITQGGITAQQRVGAGPHGGGDFGAGSVSVEQPEHRIGFFTMLRWIVVIGALIGLAVPAWRALDRRRRLVRAGRQPRRLILATYDVFAERAADLGLGPEQGETPFEYRRRIEATGRLRDGNLDRMTMAVVRAAYAPEPPTVEDVADVSADAEQTIRELRRSTSLRRRFFGLYRRD